MRTPLSERGADPGPAAVDPPVSPGSNDEPGEARLRSLAADLSVERLAHGAMDGLAGVAIERVLGVALFLALPFMLSPPLLGVFYEVIALVAVVTVVATAGLDVGVVRFTGLVSESADMGGIRPYLRTALRLGAVTSVTLAATLWILAPRLAALFGAPALTGALRLGVVAVPFMVLAAVVVAPGKGLKLMRHAVAAVQLTQPLVQLAATVALVALGFGVKGAALGFVLSAAASCAVGLLLLRRLRLPRHDGRPPSVTRKLLRFSVPVTGLAVTTTALMWLDTLLIGAFRGPSEVATYAVVVRFLTLSTAAVLAVMQILGPFVTQLVARGDVEGLRSALRTATRWAVGLAGPILGVLTVGAGGLLVLFRQTGAGGAIAMAILCIGFLADALTLPAGHVLTMAGRPAVNLWNALAALVTNTALNLLLIPMFGVEGAAISWSVALTGLAIARLIEVRMLFGVSPWHRALGKPFAAQGMAFAGAFLTHRGLAASGRGLLFSVGLAAMTYLAIYAIAMWRLGLEVEDRVLLRTLLGARRSGSAGVG